MYIYTSPSFPLPLRRPGDEAKYVGHVIRTLVVFIPLLSKYNNFLSEFVTPVLMLCACYTARGKPTLCKLIDHSVTFFRHFYI